MTEKSKAQTSKSDLEEASVTYRVKLYQLNTDTNWEDKGTGFCTYKKGSDDNPDQIVVHSETTNELLVKSDVLKRRSYQRQQETLIVWTEDDNQDLALSFQDPAGCEEIWQIISNKQNSTKTSKNEVDRYSPDLTSLPDPELDNLKEVLNILTSVTGSNEKDELVNYILVDNYLDKLFMLFETVEDLESIMDLHIFYNIMIALLILKDKRIYEQLVKDENIYQFMGSLEYNPNAPKLKAKHREYIKKQKKAKQVIKLKDEMIKKVNQTFRLEYLSNILQQEKIDDSTLNNIVFQNHFDIINHIQNNQDILDELFFLIKDQSLSEIEKLDIIRFVYQLFNLTKQMQSSIRLNLLRTLSNYGLFDILSFGFQSNDIQIKSMASKILANFTDLDVTTVRNHLLSQAKSNENPLIEVLIKQFSSNSHHQLKVQYFEALKLLLDLGGNSPTSNLSNDTPEVDEFLQLFYDKYSNILLSPIESLTIKPMSLTGPVEPLNLTKDEAQLCFYVTEFLYFAIRNHGFRSKYILLSSDLFSKIVQLYRSKYVYIKLCALRFFRVCLSLSDEFYYTHLIKHNVFEPTIRVLLDTEGKNCLLNSACLELLEYIRKENIKPILNHIINQFGTVLDTITYISTPKQLRLKFDQNLESIDHNTNNIEDNSKPESDKKSNHDGWSSSTMDDEEEDYFNGPEETEEELLLDDIPKTIPSIDSTQEEGIKRKLTEEDSAEGSEKDELLQNKKLKTQEEPLLPPKRALEEDEDDVFVKKSRQSPLTKKIVIKTSLRKL